MVAELARQFGGEVPGLTVNRPTLEDTYLELIGDLGGAGMTTTTTEARPRTAPAPAPLPSLLTTGLSRGRIEVTTFFREREAVVFIFALPAVLLLLLGSIFNSEHVQVPGVTTGQLYAAGMIAGGIAATSFQYLGISVASERDQGLLKRLYGTPLPHAAYFIGKIIQVFVCLIAEVTLLMVVGVAFFHLHLPSDAG